ncbi:hypothetical protein, partial [Congregibacter sp.]|uniref:hypothetical protein n=1 Tax=Congregibacter sp. TaxID=2744308 RepID=UPI00385ED39B
MLQIPVLAYGDPEDPGVEACKVDRLQIDSITQIKPAGGLDAVGEALLQSAIEGVILAPIGIGFKAVKAGKSATTVTGTKVLKQAGGKVFSEYTAVLDDLTDSIDEWASEEDDFRIRINGKPFHRQRMSLVAGDRSLGPECFGCPKSTSILGKGTVQLIEYDDNSVNDNLGRFTVEDELTIVGEENPIPGGDAIEPINEGEDIVVSAPLAENNSIYRLSYTLFPGDGSIEDLPERLLCGYSECWDATEGYPRQAGSISVKEPALSCPAGYSLVYNPLSTDAYKFGNNFLTSRSLSVCELIPDCGDTFDELSTLGGPEALRDGDIIVLRTFLERDRSEDQNIFGGSKVYFYGSREGGQYLGVAPGIGKDLARVHVMDPNRLDAQWRVSHLPSGEVVLQSASTGAYMTRCLGCSGIDGNSLKVDTYKPSVYGKILFGDRGNNKYDLEMGGGQWNIGAYGYNPDTDTPDVAVEGTSLFVPDIYVKDLAGYKYLARPIPARWDPGWTVLVKDQSQPLVIIDCVDCEIDESVSFQYRSLLVNRDASYVIDRDVVLGRGQTITNNGTLVITGNLIVDSAASIQNMGSIQVRGSVVLDGVLKNEVGGTLLNNPDARYNLLGSINGGGELINRGRLENEDIIRVASVSNSGTILDLTRGGFISAIIQNTGEVYTRDRTNGSRLETNTANSAGGRRILDARFFSASGLGCSGIGRWQPETLTCEEVVGWIPSGATWVVGEGVTLDSSDLSSRLVMDGSLINYGQVTGFENIEACGGALTNLNGDESYGSADFAACAVSAQEAECEKFVGGAWNDITKVCVADGYRKDSEQEFSDESNESGFWSLVIPDGVTYKLYYLRPNPLIEGYREEGFSIVIQNGGKLVTQYAGGGNEKRSSGFIQNYGTIDLGEPETCNECNGVDYLYLENVSLDNYGVVSSPIEVLYSSVRNYCGGSVSLRRPEFDTFKISQEVPCAAQDYDGDGVDDFADFDPLDPSVRLDSDGDGVADSVDAFPNDPSETKDSDEDGVGDSADFLPLSRLEIADTDGDGVGDNSDFAPNDPSESVDTDGDGVGDNSDFAPNDPGESADTDRDKVGDNADAFPNAKTEQRWESIALRTTLSDSDSACTLMDSEFI